MNIEQISTTTLLGQVQFIYICYGISYRGLADMDSNAGLGLDVNTCY